MSPRFVALEPPATHCQHQAVFDALRRTDGRTFVEVGCGDGSLSSKLCAAGYRGVGIDFAEAALEVARDRLDAHLESGRFELRLADFMADPAPATDRGRFDIGLSMMVIEHVEDDAAFVRRLCAMVREGGLVLVGVPGRRDRWGIEDEQVGHLRRYERADLAARLEEAGLEEVTVWSVSVPLANLLFPLGNLLLRRRTVALAATDGSLVERTMESGIRQVPLKTVFPASFRWVLNPTALYPFSVLQRLFYRSSLGLTLLGFGRKVGGS